MNIKDIKALTAVLTQADLSVLDYSEGDMHIRLEELSHQVLRPLAGRSLRQLLPAIA